jgi:acyl-CoA oxidase
VTRLQAFLDGAYREVRDEVRARLRRPGFAPVVDLPDDAYRERVLEQARVVAAEGGGAIGYPEAYGGRGDVGASVTAFQTLAHGDLSLLVKCGVQFGLFGGAVLQLGTERHHRAHLRDIASLALIGCFAMTETGHGSDVQSLGTTATYDPATAEFVVHTPDAAARKDYIGNAADHGRMAAVFAQLVTQGRRHGVHAFLVPIRDAAGGPCPGVTLEDCGHKIGLNGVDNGRILFDHVRVPREALLDRFGSVAPNGTYTSPIEHETKRFFTMLATLVQGRVSVAGGSIAATQNALTIAVRYGLARRQFSPPDSEREVLILDYLAHQRRLLPRLATTYAFAAAQQVLVADLDATFTDPDTPEQVRRELESRAAGIKALATWHASDTIQACRESCGGAGYLAENGLGALRADTDVFTTFEGDNTVLLQLVAKGLLTDFRDEFGPLDAIGMVRFVADQVVGAVVERTAVRQVVQSLLDAVPGVDEEADIRERGWQLDLLRWRATHVLEGLARRLRGGIEDGEDPFEVFNRAQDHVLLAARAHVEREVAECFVARIAEVDDGPTRDLLERVCDLHALALLERERGWFLEHGRMTSTRAKAVVAAVNDLCGELRPHAGELVAGFAVPDEALGAALLDPPDPAPALATGGG